MIPASVIQTFGRVKSDNHRQNAFGAASTPGKPAVTGLLAAGMVRGFHSRKA